MNPSQIDASKEKIDESSYAMHPNEVQVEGLRCMLFDYTVNVDISAGPLQKRCSDFRSVILNYSYPADPNI